jgi:hypothetical protein
MRKARHTLILMALVLAGSAGAVAWSDQQRASSLSDQQILTIANRLTRQADQLKRTIDLTMARGSVNPSRYEDNLSVLAQDFSDSVWHLRDHATRRQIIATDIDDVLNSATKLERLMRRNQADADIDRAWRAIRTDLDQLGRGTEPPWDWNSPRSNPAPLSAALYHRLTGTYQLDSTRSDDAQRLVDQAVRSLPAAQRDRVSRNLLNRLDAPQTLSIDRNERQVTIASSDGPQITFEANGQPTTETNPNGRTVTTRADVQGDQLVVSTSGSNGSDYTVTIEPTENGNTLRVTRRLYNNNLNQPVSVQSVYRRTAEQPRWDVYNPEMNDFAMADGTRIVARLEQALSSRTSREGDQFTLTVISPAQYAGAKIDGSVIRVNDLQRSGTSANLVLDLDAIQLRNSGRASSFDGILESARTPDGQTIRIDSENAVRDPNTSNQAIQRGAIGAAVGAIIGALAGGGKGAAIGAAIGGAGGAGTVLIEGRDRLDLPIGTELTIVARR